MRRSFLVSSVAAFGVLITSVQAQGPATPIKSFAELAGKWDGLSSPSGVKVNLEINDKGAFFVSSRLGEDKGTATLEEGVLNVRYTSNQGYMKLSMISGALEGPVVYQTRTGSIKFTRVR